MMFALTQYAHAAGWLTTVNRFDLLTAAAKKDHAEAIFELGLCCIEGIGTLSDTETGAKLILKAAHAGCVKAQSHTALSFINGATGFEKNPTEGFAWLAVANANGSGQGVSQPDKTIPGAVRARAEELWKTCKVR